MPSKKEVEAFNAYWGKVLVYAIAEWRFMDETFTSFRHKYLARAEEAFLSNAKTPVVFISEIIDELKAGAIPEGGTQS